MFTQLLRRVTHKIPAPLPAFPQGKAALLPEEDDPELIIEEKIEGLSSTVFITYKNANGEVSKRRISIKVMRVNAAGNKVLCAYCFEREAYREFRIDRIAEIIDIETGEILELQKMVLDIQTDLEDIAEIDPLKETKAVLRKCKHALNALIYLARCDGHFHHEEENIVLHYLVSECFDCNFNDEYLVKRLKRYYPDSDAFYDALDYLEQHPDQLKRVFKYAAQLVQADGVIAREETNFISEIAAYAA